MRIIDADALIKALAEMWYEGQISVTGISVSELINKQPTIDAESVVRCKECKYADKCSRNVAMQDTYQMYEKIDYCSYGERKEP